MKDEKLLAFCMVLVVVSFLGFVVENVWLSMVRGFMDNRNMCLPSLLGYGLAIGVIYLLFGTPINTWILGKEIKVKSRLVRLLFYFLMVMICICVGELVLGMLVEKICHFSWWDYSQIPLHITQYTSVPTSSAFSLLICFFMNRIFDPLMRLFLEWDYKTLYVMGNLLVLVLVVDFIYNSYLMYKNKGITQRWRINTENSRMYRLLHER